VSGIGARIGFCTPCLRHRGQTGCKSPSAICIPFVILSPAAICHSHTNQSDEMTNVPRKYAGFGSAFSVLDDQTLTDAQKRTALVSWRSAMERAIVSSDDGRTRRDGVLNDIDAALAILDRET
jgi:hypothetical protein